MPLALPSEDKASAGLCSRATEERVPASIAAEACAARAILIATSDRLEAQHLHFAYAFHLVPGAGEGVLRCIVARCDSGAAVPQDGAVDKDWQSYAPQDLCPGGRGMPAVLAESMPLSLDDAGLSDSARVPLGLAKVEFQRLFGPGLIRRDQRLKGMRTECSSESHRVAAEVCFGDSDENCDEWSKYSLPRCHISLSLPFEPMSEGFLYAPACERKGQLYCPPGLPIALQLTLKAGSRSANVWAAMLEGLLPALSFARRNLAVALSDSGEAGGGQSRLGRYVQEWLEHDESRLGCTPETALFSVMRGLHLFAESGRIGLPLSLCPTCCRSGAGRLRVIFIRNPLLRLRSFFKGYWAPLKRHLLPPSLLSGADDFETWVFLILGPGRSNHTLFESTDLDHVAPALRLPLGEMSSETGVRPVVFSVEDTKASLRRVERALCGPPFFHCTPLPEFPGVQGTARSKSPSGDRHLSVESLPDEVRPLVLQHFRHDFDALASLSEEETAIGDDSSGPMCDVRSSS